MVIEAELLLPMESVAETAIMFAPLIRVMPAAVKVLLDTAAFMPFTVTVAALSSIVPVTEIVAVFTVAPFAGEVIEIRGAVVSAL